MKFAELLGNAHNVAFSSFDWGFDAVAYLNRRLLPGQQLTLQSTGTDAHVQLLTLKTSEMLEILNREVEINGTRLTVLDHPDPPPTPVAILPQDPLYVQPPAALPIDDTSLADHSSEEKKTAKWPIFVAASLAIMAITVALAMTTGDQLGVRRNHDTARSALTVLIDILRTLNGTPSGPTENTTPEEPQPSGPTQSTPETGKPSTAPTHEGHVDPHNPYGV